MIVSKVAEVVESISLLRVDYAKSGGLISLMKTIDIALEIC